MNYRQALPRKTDGRYDYTHTRDKHTTPIGYCMGPGLASRIGAVGDPNKYHIDGHATADEAWACYVGWYLDNHEMICAIDDRLRSECVICGEFTFENVRVGPHGRGWQWYMHERHADRETIERLMLETGSVSVASW